VKTYSYEPELQEARDLRQRGNDVDSHYEKDDAGLTAGGRGRGRLEPRHADVTLDSKVNSQPDGSRVKYGR